MRLLRVVLKNYIGIFNGMGLRQLDIDFSKSIRPITVIKGDNGTGKSTLFKAITPLPDSSIEFMKGEPAYKLIVYGLDDGTILYIEYISDIKSNGERSSMKANIKRFYPSTGDKINLNPNGNVTSAKEIIYNFFGLDDNFLMLSQISASKKGLGSLKPYDRKRYVNSIISQLSDFITMNKLFTKKSMVLKSMVNQFVSKLQQIGNVELVNSELIKTDQEINIQKNKERELLVEISSYTAKLKESKNRKELEDELSELEDNLLKINEIRENTDIKDLDSLKEYINNLQSIIEKTKSNLIVLTSNRDSLKTELDKIVNEEEGLRNEINDIEIKLQSGDFVGDQYTKKIEELNKIIYTLKERYSKFKVRYAYEATADEYTEATNMLKEINDKLQEISNKDYYDSSLVKEALLYTKLLDVNGSFSVENYNKKYTETLQMITKMTTSVAKFKNKLEIIEEYEERMKLVPKECEIYEKCGLLNKVLESLKNLDLASNHEDKESITYAINLYEDNIDNATKDLKRYSYICRLKEDYYHVLLKLTNYSLLKKMFNFTDTFIFSSIINANKINLDLDDYEQFQNTYLSLESFEEEKKELEFENLKRNDDKEKIVLETRLSYLKENLSKLVDNKENNLKNNLDKILKEIEEANNKLNNSNTLFDKYSSLIENYSTINDIENKINNVRYKLSEIDDANSKLIVADSDLNGIQMNLQQLEKYKESLKYKITLYDQYKKDYDQYNSLYYKLETFRKYSSVNGIQTIYMEVFMNSILTTANSLLTYLFKGEFTLEPFIINDKEFRIPCIDIEGNLRDDISLMSDSQLSMISMIISFALLNKASENYNIIKLDEVDNNLDNYNRVQFASLIEDIMVKLNFSQCILISHNNELDLSNTDIILFKCTDEEQKNLIQSSKANIIYNFNN